MMIFLKARMKLDRGMEFNNIATKIETLLFEVGLSSRSNVRIGTGGQHKILSGGEKKRLAFATEVGQL